jgi:hypothetical protein
MAMRMAGEPAPGYGAGYGGNGTMPQQFRTDRRGNVVPMGSEIRSAEDLQRHLEARRQGRETADGRQQTAKTKEPGTEQNAFSVGVAAEFQPKIRTNQGNASRQDFPPDDDERPKVVLPNQGKSQTTFYAREGSVAEREGYSMPGEKPGVDVELPAMGVQWQSQKTAPRPQNWALKDATQFTKGISRSVRIRCEAERFVLSAQSGLAKERAIPIAGSVSEAADQLVQAIWEFQESWGSAGENMHWKPILLVRVSPGGEQRLQELKVHLKNSGLAIEE